MSTHSPWNHRDYLNEEKDPRRAYRVHKRGQKSSHIRELAAAHCCQQCGCAGEKSKVGSRTRGEREAEPFDPLTKVIREGDESVQAAVRDRIVRARRRCGLAVLLQQLLGLSLGNGLAPDVEQDLVVVHVSREARRPEREACPEARGGRGRVGQVRGGGGGGEVGGEEEAVWCVECDGAADYDEVRFGAGGGAQGGYECAVEVVSEVERCEDEGGFEAQGGAGEGR